MSRMLLSFAAMWWPTLSSRLRRGPLLPSWSFLFEWTIRALRHDWDATADWPLDTLRAAVAARPYPRTYVKQVATRAETIAGVPVHYFTPKSPGATRIIYLHGGSYIYGSSAASHADLCAHLALATSLEVIGVEYRLAPEHTWPAQRQDALAVCASLGDAPFVLAGDSAGGHLAVKTAHSARAKALLLLSPWVDLEMPGRSFVDNDPYDFGTREALLRQAKAVAGALPLSSLALASDPLGDLPATFISVGKAEIPRDDILAFARKLRDAGVECTLHVAEDMPHNPLVFEAYHPAGREAFAAAVRFVASIA